MLVVQIGSVLVVVLQGLVVMRMRVLSDEGRIVHVDVMTVIVAMRVIVIDGFVPVSMPMTFGQVQP